MKVLSIGHLTYDRNLILESFPLEGSRVSTSEVIGCSGGSANNIAYSLAKWNIDSFISGVIGYDEVGNIMKKDLEESKVHINYLETNYDIKTSTTNIIFNKSNNSQTIITSEDKDYAIKKHEYDEQIDCIISDGYEYNASVYAFNKYAKALTILDAKTPRNGLLDFFKYTKYAICSKEVAEAMTGVTLDFNNPVTLADCYKKIIDKYPNVSLIIRAEDEGAIYSLNNEIKVLADIASTPLDKTGAHDIFVAGFAYSLLNNLDTETAIRLATIASFLSKKTVGSTLSVPILSDIITYYENKFGKLNLNNDNPLNANISANNNTNNNPTNNNNSGNINANTNNNQSVESNPNNNAPTA